MTRPWTFLVAPLLVAAPIGLQAQFAFETNADNTLTINYYDGPGGAVSIPAETNGLPVVGMEDEAFAGARVTSVTIPGSISNIAETAFWSCTRLTNVVISNGVTSMGGNAFLDCANLPGLTIPASVNSLGEFIFQNCTGLSNVTIPGRVTHIYEDMFYGCTHLAGVYFTGNAPTVTAGLSAGANATVYYLPGTSGWSSAFDGFSTGLWNPGIQIDDAGFGVQTNQFGFDITNSAPLTVVVEVCTNLASPIWTPLQTVTLSNGSFHFSETLQSATDGRFYGLGFPTP